MKPKHRSFRSFVGSTLASGAVVSFAMVGSSSASLWSGSGNSDWNNLSNWDSNPSGGVGEVNTLTNFPVITGNNTLVPNDLKIATATGTTGRVDIRSGTFTVNYWTFVGDWNGSGTLNIADTSTTGGTFTGFGMGSGSYDADNNSNGNFMVGLYQSTGVVNMNTSGSLNVTELRLSPNGQAGSATFNLDNGSVNVAGSFQAGSDFWGANTNSPAYLNMSGGSISTGFEFWVGGSGAGTGTMTGGTVNAGSWLVVGRNNGSNGVLNMSGGSVNVATNNGGAFTAIGSFGGSQGTLNLSGNADFNSTQIYVGEGGTGTMTVAGSADVDMSGGLQVGRNNGSIGNFTQSGGTVDMNGGGLVLGRYAGATGTATISGGTMTATEDSVVGFEGTGTLTVSGTGTLISPANKWFFVGKANGVSSTVNLNAGGTLEARHIERDGNGSATFNFDGGTLRVNSADDTIFDNYNENNINVYIKDQGAVIDTNGFNKTVGTDLLEDGGSTGGGLTKLGAGTLTLDGNNTYTGATIVSAGTLLVTGALGNTAVTVESGATIAGSGSLAGTLTLEDGAMLDTTAGTIIVTGLVQLGTATDHFDFGNLVGFDVNTAAPGTYTFMSGSNIDFTFVDYFGAENALALSGGRSAYFQNGSLQVVVIPEPGAALLGGIGMLALLRRRRTNLS